MAKTDDNLMQRLLVLFASEAEEHLDGIAAGMAKLQDPQIADHAIVIETVFREVHSLKGAARSVELARIEQLCQVVEQQFAALRRGKAALTEPLLGSLGDAIVGIERAVREVCGPKPASGPAPSVDSQPEAPPATIPSTPALTTVRVDAEKLDSLMLIAEEQLQLQLTVQERHKQLRQLTSRLNAFLRMHGSETTAPTVLAEMAQDFDALTRTLGNDRYAASGLTERLLNQAKELALLPFSEITMRLPKLVGDLARAQGKQVVCELTGDSLKIDRRILASLRDPLLHLMRNCVDHGIESPDERRRRGKSPRGRVTVAIAQTSIDTVSVTVSDDGAGVDVTRLREQARHAGQTLTTAQALNTIFDSGVTTRDQVTTVSGRGLGMAIVRDTVEGLGGAVTLTSTPGQGMCCTLQLPLTVSTYRGTFVRAGGQTFIVPSASIEWARRCPLEQIRTVENRGVLTIGERPLSVIRLDALLELRPATDRGPHITLLTVHSGNDRVALVVDEILREAEVLAKTLGPLLPNVPFISGCASIPSGELILVLNPVEVVRAAADPSAAPIAATEEAKTPAGKCILVVEDSITARVLLQNILEAAGYDVRTAVDGVDALAILRNTPIALVVSDVEMPRMNGFELTAKIRASDVFKDLPVILITALENPEDRERGIDAGANAYVAKSSFDQTNLIELIERLV